jgi:hypothetical protein
MKTPRNIRPSFVEILVEGRKSVIRTGPKAKNGKMFLHFFVRNKGKVERRYTLSFIPSNGKLEVKGENLESSNYNRCFLDSFDLD